MKPWSKLVISAAVVLASGGAAAIRRRIGRTTPANEKPKHLVIEDEHLLSADWDKWASGPTMRVVRTIEELKQFHDELETQTLEARWIASKTKEELADDFYRKHGKTIAEALQDPTFVWEL